MRNTWVQSSDAGRRVEGFLDTHAAVIGTTVPATLRAQLDQTVAQFQTYQLEQETADTAAHSETANQAAYQVGVYTSFLRPIGRIAKRALTTAPDLADMVVTLKDVQATSAFVTKATAVATTAAKYTQTFVDHGMAADFVAQMQAAIAKITTSVDTRGRQLSRRSTATDGLEAADKSMRELIGVLDSVLTPALKDNPDVLSDWNASKRIRQTVVTPLPTGSVADTAGAPAPTLTPSTSLAAQSTPAAIPAAT